MLILKSAAPKKLKVINGILQGSVLGPILLLLCIKDFHKAIEHISAHHFAEDTNILFINKSFKKNKYINRNLKFLYQFIESNKLSLNTDKTVIII